MTNSLYETFRLARLKRLGLLDTPPEERFDRITRMARDVFEVDVALVSLLDRDRQWFKSRQGLDVTQTPRQISFCDHAIALGRELIIEDASLDDRFRSNPLVTGDPGIRFYAGVTVREPTGFKLGTLCVIGSEPKTPQEHQIRALQELGRLVEHEISVGFYRDIEGSGSIDGSMVLRALGAAQTALLANGDLRAQFERVLHEIQVATKSPVGAIIEVDNDQSLTDCQDDISALLNVPCIERAATGTSLPELISIFRRYQSGSRSKGLVDVFGDPLNTGSFSGEHTHQNFAALPVLAGDRLVGGVYLADREGGYPEDLLESLAPLSLGLGVLIEKTRVESSRHSQKRLLEQAANYDSLTQVPNRHLLSRLMKEKFHDALIDRRTVEICFLNIDNFNDINVKFGRHFGDAVLMEIATRIQQTIGVDDVMARVGGDEFVIGISTGNSTTNISAVLERVEQPINNLTRSVQIGLSAGIAVFPDDGQELDPLLRCASLAMFSAKQSGKASVQRFDSQRHQSKLAQSRLLDEVRSGLGQGQFELYYQPKVNLQTNRVVGFEGLIRWNHPTEGFKAPDQFLPQIALSETDKALGCWVMKQAVETLQRFDHEGLDYGLSINLSPYHFMSPDFVKDLKESIGQAERHIVSRLTLEILETAALDDSDTAAESIQACRNLGCQVSLDDFGTGYSSLSHFRQLPLDEIKIDKSFVWDLLENPGDGKIVESIVNLSRQFNRRTVAEGIENGAVLRKLLDMGCDIGQGYFFSKPQPLDDILNWALRFENAFVTFKAS